MGAQEVLLKFEMRQPGTRELAQRSDSQFAVHQGTRRRCSATSAPQIGGLGIDYSATNVTATRTRTSENASQPFERVYAINY